MDKELDDALAKDKIRDFLTQSMKEEYNFNQIVTKFKEVFQWLLQQHSRCYIG